MISVTYNGWYVYEKLCNGRQTIWKWYIREWCIAYNDTTRRCICRVKIENQIETVCTGLWKYDGLTSSTPVDNVCVAYYKMYFGIACSPRRINKPSLTKLAISANNRP